MIHDPIVDEVRAIREQLAAQCDFDIRKIIEDAQRRQTTFGWKIVSFQQPDKAPPQGGAMDAVSPRKPATQAGPPAEC